MLRSIIAVIAVCCATSAFARPATIAVFEAVVYASPDPKSKVLERLAEGTAISVDETGENGWRRVRLSDGKRVGWIEDAVLKLGASVLPAPEVAPTPSPEAPAPEAPPAPPLGEWPRDATIRTFRAKVFASPRKDGDLVELLAQNATVSALEPAVDGWQRVRTASGLEGWVTQADLGAGPSPTAALDVGPTAPPPGPAPSPIVQRPYPPSYAPSYAPLPRQVGSLSALERFMGDDPEFSARASSLSSRRTWSWVGFGVGIGLGSLIMAGGASDLDNMESYFVVGGLVMVGGAALFLSLLVDQDEIDGLIYEWNRVHSDDQIMWREPTYVYVPTFKSYGK